MPDSQLQTASLIERISQDNFKQAFSIHCQCNPNPWSEKMFGECLGDNYIGVQAKFNGQITGYYIIQQVLDEVTLIDIGVAPLWRQQSIADQLMLHLIEYSREQQVVAVWLEVRNSNSAARALYAKWQFSEIDVRRGYYSCADGKEDGIVMKLDLPVTA